MKIEKAIEVLMEKYNQAKDNPQIDDPVAWALYRAWRIADKDKDKLKREKPKGADDDKKCHKPPSAYYRAYCEERKEKTYCEGCEFWY